MKILSVIESLAHGGAETVLVDLVLGLSEHTHQVVHFSSANGIPVHTPFIEALTAAGVPLLIGAKCREDAEHAYFAEHGLFTLHAAHAAAIQSRCS